MNDSFVDISVADGTFRAFVTTPPGGSGPGLILLPEIFGLSRFMRETAAQFAEEGYVCFVPDMFWRQEPGTALEFEQREHAMALRAAYDIQQGADDLIAVAAALRAHPAQRGGVGALGFCMGGTLACLAAGTGLVDVVVAYYPTGLNEHLTALQKITCPLLIHFGAADDKIPDTARSQVEAAISVLPDARLHLYPECAHAFANHTRDGYARPAAMMAYSRSIALLRRVLGPNYDLSELWEAHITHEFAERDVDATMETMVAEPYVNHIPTMTGGVGHDHLKRFYKHHFVNSNPPDTRMIPVSRTVGTDRLVDEMVFCFTHTCEIPWMLPGIEPTGRYVEIPLVAIVNFRGNKLYHEHIYWDQASVLAQIGRLDTTGLPVAGIATAKKLLDETLPSNELMACWSTSADKPL